MPHRRHILLACLLLSLLAACRPVPEAGVDVPRIRAEELYDRIEAGRKTVVVDTRTAKSFLSARIPGALSIPARETADHLDKLPKNALIAFY